MIKNKINSEFSGEINEIQFDDKKLYEAVLRTAQRIEKDRFEASKDLIAELSDFFEKISEILEISYEKTSETLFKLHNVLLQQHFFKFTFHFFKLVNFKSQYIKI